jgi:hypothetical protein
MVAETFTSYIVSAFLILSLYGIAISFRLTHTKGVPLPGHQLLYNVPMMLLLLSAIGASISVGFFSIVSTGTLLLIIGLLIFLRPQINKIDNGIPLLIGVFLIYSTLFWLRVWLHYDTSNQNWFCIHHDDYSYIQQTNLLALTGKESHFYELIRAHFGLDFVYKPYHYPEFYLIILLKKLFGGSTYLWLQIGIKSLLAVTALHALYAYAQSKQKGAYWWWILVISALFFTLRYIIPDDFLRDIIPGRYAKSVFFQNYYGVHPLSYFRGYKVALAIIYVLPVYFLVQQKSFIAAILFSMAASIVSVGLLPICMIMVAWALAKQWFTKYWVLSGVVLFTVGSLSFKYYTSAQKTSLLAFLNNEWQFIFNQIFEHHFWQIFFVAIALLMLGVKGIRRVYAILLCLFPLIYVQYNILFKIFSLLALSGVLYYELRQKDDEKSIFNNALFWGMALLYGCLPYVAHIANTGQVYTNVLFLFVCVVCIDVLQLHTFANAKIVAVFASIYIVVMALPALIYDAKVPLHSEVIPNKVTSFIGRSGQYVNALSLSTYPHSPHIDHDQLGNGLLNVSDKVVVTLGGIEMLSNKDSILIKNIGYGGFLDRLPYTEWLRKKRYTELNGLIPFIQQYNIKMVLLENSNELEKTYNILQDYFHQKEEVEGMGYTIFFEQKQTK